LTSEETNSTIKRSNKFIIDPLVKTGSADNSDYAGSGYDKGHLAPAGDMGWSATSMKESFYYSNMSPQVPSFNRGVWKRVEELVRAWANEYKSVYIVTGPVLTNGLPTIGHDKVSVPKYFYKVILEYNASGTKGIGFVIPNAASQESLQRYAVSIDSVEKITGIDFFPLLPDKQEKAIESNLNVNEWTWKSFKSTAKKEKLSASVQCSGITKKGTRCKNRTTNASGRCYLH
jgi:endonuclease G